MAGYCTVERAELWGPVVVPSNKSYTHRAIFMGALANGTSYVRNPLISRDTMASVEAARAFGAKVEMENGMREIKIVGRGYPELRTGEIDASNSGTTMRISAAIAGLCGSKVIINGDSSLSTRPMQPIVDAINRLGARCASDNGRAPLAITGRDGMEGGEVSVDGTISSQFISGLCMAAALMEKGLTINIDGELVSKPYLDATIATQRRFGVDVKTEIPYKRYRIDRQDYRGAVFYVPGDYSSAALMIAGGILNSREMMVYVDNSEGLPQADQAFVNHARRLGGDIVPDYQTSTQMRIRGDVLGWDLPKRGILVRGGDVKGGYVDLSNSPDSLPATAILGLRSADWVKIGNVKQARYKETDRIALLARELPKMGATVEENRDGLWIRTERGLNRAILDPRASQEKEGDHRLFMAFVMAGAYAGGASVIDPRCVDVSYSQFLNHMKMLRGRVRVG
ncbi:MAG: 3-phosphoshikimate 1-carboxyvinyltransferase [Candidatus Micrarchaeota archaeon]|nr:3-phosphoshikimate 1-carboxyvinyltransferase [Candidatus Micrarchaeota archaeon]